MSSLDTASALALALGEYTWGDLAAAAAPFVIVGFYTWNLCAGRSDEESGAADRARRGRGGGRGGTGHRIEEVCAAFNRALVAFNFSSPDPLRITAADQAARLAVKLVAQNLLNQRVAADLGLYAHELNVSSEGFLIPRH